MAKTLTGSSGMTGSFTLTDSETLGVITQPLASTKAVVATPDPVPASPSDSGWNVNHIYSTSFHKGLYEDIDSSTGVTLTFSSLSDALCGASPLTKIQSLTIENLGAQALRVTSDLLCGGTSAYVIIPAYAKYRLEVPMQGVDKGATTSIVLKSAASTTDAFVVIAYK